MTVLREFDESQQQGVVSAAEAALHRQLTQQLTALKARFHDCFFKTARWQFIPEPGTLEDQRQKAFLRMQLNLRMLFHCSSFYFVQGTGI